MKVPRSGAQSQYFAKNYRLALTSALLPYPDYRPLVRGNAAVYDAFSITPGRTEYPGSESRESEKDI